MEYLREVNLLSICVRLSLSMVIGGILGVERGRKNRPAGFRTYVLVCLGAALVMMTNQYIFQRFGQTDPARLGAQVISGIGFLGAGTILITGRHQIKGITTAAGLWTAACCGLAVGIGFYEAALVGGLLILIVMGLLEKLEGRIRRRSPVIDVYIEFTKKKMFSEFLTAVRESGLEVSDIQMIKNKYANSNGIGVTLTLEDRAKRPHADVLALVNGIEGVTYAEEL